MRQKGEVSLRDMLLHLKNLVEDGQDVVLKLYALGELEHVENWPDCVYYGWLLFQVRGGLGDAC